MKEVLEVIIKNLVNNKDAVEIKEVENEKYAFRCFLLRLGFIGADLVLCKILP